MVSFWERWKKRDAAADAEKHLHEALLAQMTELARENAGLRDMVKRLESRPPPQWPEPQPIDSAPDSDVLAWSARNRQWCHIKSGAGGVVYWRQSLKSWGYTAWLPVPMPGGSEMERP